MDFIKYRKIYYGFSLIIVFISIFVLLTFGLKLGIDFKGGSILEGNYSKILPANDKIKEVLNKIGLSDSQIQQTDRNSILIRFKEVDEAKHQEIKSVLENLGKDVNADNNFSEISFESLGPAIGRELKMDTLKAIILVLVLIFAYIAYAFRGVSYPLKSWKYGVVTLVTLFHDIIIPLGAFALLGVYKNIEINISFVAAILTVLGYSVHDTIIVFDRIRENLSRAKKLNFEEVINQSLKETFLRSINTSLTVIFVLLVIYFFGGETIKYFSLALLIGIATGTYSSIFIASPLLFTWQKMGVK